MNQTVDNDNLHPAISEGLLNKTMDELDKTYSNKMLPSTYRRTSTLLGKEMDKSITTVGPADYDKERILGNESIT